MLERPRGDSLEIIHIWPKVFGNDDRAVFLLIVFENGHNGSTDRKARAVQRMDKSRLSTLWAIADIGPPGLIILEVAAGRDLAVFIL